MRFMALSALSFDDDSHLVAAACSDACCSML
jgi:hypothetical protein